MQLESRPRLPVLWSSPLLHLVLWCIVIFILSSVPGNRYPEVTYEHADKLVHVFQYLFGGVTAYRYFSLSGRMPLAKSVAFCALYGLSDEIHQIFVPRRTFSMGDVLADTVGGLLGAVTYHIAIAKRVMVKQVQ